MTDHDPNARPTFRATVADDAVHGLAEGPVWDDARQRLLWVDIPAGEVFEGRLDGDRVEVVLRHTFHGTVGAVVPARDEGLLVAGQRGPILVDPDGGVRHGPDLLPAGADSRLNDGACDPAGRFLVGSLPFDDRTGGERLYRIDADGSATVVDEGFTLSNGLGFSPDGATLHHVDSVPGIVWVRSYDVATGALGPREEAFRPADGTPDGLCVDVEGHLWIAMWGAGQVRRYTTDGQLLATVEVPAPNTSSVAFVGPTLDRLLITTATEDLSAADRASFPDAGKLFLADVGVAGLPSVPWAGVTTDRPT